MAYNLFKNWWYLSVNTTKSENALEPAIAALGRRYRSQWLFAGLRHIADFVLLDDRVIIEVDGKSHENAEQRYKDVVHTIALEKMGWKVVRCSNDEAQADPEGTLHLLLSQRLHSRPTLQALEAALSLLPPPAKKTRRRAQRLKPAPASAPPSPGAESTKARKRSRTSR